MLPLRPLKELLSWSYRMIIRNVRMQLIMVVSVVRLGTFKNERVCMVLWMLMICRNLVLHYFCSSLSDRLPCGLVGLHASICEVQEELMHTRLHLQLVFLQRLGSAVWQLSLGETG